MPNEEKPCIEDVFVTDGFPKHSYVDADEGRAEQELRDGLAIASKIISIVGPSKCGKTTLCDHIFGTDRGTAKIALTGDSFESDSQFWQSVYAQTSAAREDDQLTSVLGADLHRDVIIDGVLRDGMPIVIDDFHYVPRPLQVRLCQQMKGAAARGVRFLILTVPHRGDDPIRTNPELAGRFFSVDLNFWSYSNLRKIAETGFRTLQVEVEPEVLDLLSREALGSPQLMQTLCLELARSQLDLDMPFQEQVIFSARTDWDVVRRKALRVYDFTTAFRKLKSGPPRRGQRRAIYTRADGQRGDVYDLIVKVLGTNPPFSSIAIEEIRDRGLAMLNPVPANAPNFHAALMQIESLFPERTRPVEYDPGTRCLSVVDPHFYFFLRAQVAQRPTS